MPPSAMPALGYKAPPGGAARGGLSFSKTTERGARKAGTGPARRCLSFMSFLPSRFVVLGRMALPLVLAGVFFAGPIAAFATSPAVVPVPEHRVAHVISVIPFARVGDETCMPDPVRVGPHEQSGRLLLVWSLADRMGAAAARCLDASPGSLTLSVTVDAHGNIGE